MTTTTSSDEATASEGQSERAVRTLGLRPEALPAWRVLSSGLQLLVELGIHTPCDEDAGAFFSTEPGMRLLAAKACAACPVRHPCDRFASTNRERAGVWGGRDRTWGTSTWSQATPRPQRPRTDEAPVPASIPMPSLRSQTEDPS